MRRLLCSPTYFDIEYSINPWMDLDNKVDQALAHRQWNNLVELLQKLGDNLEFITPVAGLPDMTFAGDAGIVIGNTFIPSNFKDAQRRPESSYYTEWFSAHDFDIVHFPQEIVFEGLGDVVFAGRRIIAGHGGRSSAGAVSCLREVAARWEVVCDLVIKDMRYFHLAMALSFIDEETVLYVPDAFDGASVQRLQKTIRRTIPISAEDANRYFACNNLVVGRNVVLDGCTMSLRKALEQLGYEPVFCPMSEFKKSGGSLRCLVLTHLQN